ncbi:MAG: hypothetical protein Q8L53_10045 [Aestuariivirga sp.]|nr:hypothetical protein [Aestuariivirga sp.]
MTAPEMPALPAPDWAAIRKAYEDGDDPLPVVAVQYGTSISAMALRRRKENWPTRRNRARIARGLAAFPPRRRVDWPGVRLEYESGEFTVRDICERHGICADSFYSVAHRESWRARRPKTFGAGGPVKTTKRLRDLVTSTLAGLEARRALGEKIDTDDALRGLHQLASLTVKILDIEHRENRRDDAERTGRLIIDDATRLALARRLEALADSWESAGSS